MMMRNAQRHSLIMRSVNGNTWEAKNLSGCSPWNNSDTHHMMMTIHGADVTAIVTMTE